MLVLDRRTEAIAHSRFYKLARLLREGDLLMLNNTRVLPARLLTHKETGGEVELLMVRPADMARRAWIALARTHRPLREGTKLLLPDGRTLIVAGYQRQGRPLVVRADGLPMDELLSDAGTLALPHYIDREVQAADTEHYQTVYAQPPGAIAAPTAGLHFTDALLGELATAGVRSAFLTLHIGPGTFTPVRVSEIEHHSMEAEWYTIPRATVAAVAHAHRVGGRVIAVGTSTARALESWAITGDTEGFTGLFICPGFRFKRIDAMITNFHMPRSTVLALVMAFAGREAILCAYADAIRRRYRFLSYGDAMLIL
jgi:S-adenosylmethionine:tRNA ribosyltransferase-isomerase